MAVVLAAAPDSVLLIRRADREGDPWSGQMGMPGGRRDTADPDLLATARRETLEEVGLDPKESAHLGRLDDVSPRTPTATPVVVRPYVFTLDRRYHLTLNAEVAFAIWVDLSELRRPDIYRPVTLQLRGQSRSFPAYHLESGVVWGLTERILTPLLDLTR